MGKASSAKKVARAARAGGGRRPGQRRQVGFPLTIMVIVVLGVALVWYARDTREATADPRQDDHWHAAYGVYICDAFQPPMSDALQDPVGIHTHQDGVIHIHPFVSASAGNNARMRHFLDDTGLSVSNDEITLPDGTSYKEGEDECDGERAQVRVLRWANAADAQEGKDPSEVFTDDFDDIRFRRDREAYTIAFAPAGADVPAPDTIPTLDNLSDVTPNDGATSSTVIDPSATSSTVAGDTTSSTAAPAGTDTSTTAPADTTSTTAAGSP